VNPTCGFEFACPDLIHFVCTDTANGPVCSCADGFTGFPTCLRRPCTNVIGENGTIASVGCFIGNSEVKTVDNVCVCACKDGSSGDFCNQTNSGNGDDCQNVNCSKIPNTECRDGKCVCTDGFVRDGNATAAAQICIPITSPPSCVGVQCKNNAICVLRDSKPACVCPAESFGAAECDRPACSSDADCLKIANNTVCANNVNEGVTRFCQCLVGFTGDRCGDRAPTCTAQSCNGTCTNEGRCVPAAVFCLEITITLKSTANYTAEEVAARIADLLKIDVRVVVVTGPFKLEDGKIRFYAKICGDDDFDAFSSQSDALSQGTNMFSDSDSVDSGHVTSDSTGATSTMPNEANSNAVVAILTAVAVGVALM